MGSAPQLPKEELPKEAAVCMCPQYLSSLDLTWDRLWLFHCTTGNFSKSLHSLVPNVVSFSTEDLSSPGVCVGLSHLKNPLEFRLTSIRWPWSSGNRHLHLCCPLQGGREGSSVGPRCCVGRMIADGPWLDLEAVLQLPQALAHSHRLLML